VELFSIFESKQNSVIDKGNVGLVAGRFVNSIDTVNAPGIKKIVLLSSSMREPLKHQRWSADRENRKCMRRMGSLPPKKIFLVALYSREGKFSSPFLKIGLGKIAMDSMQQFGTPFLTQCIY